MYTKNADRRTHPSLKSPKCAPPISTSRYFSDYFSTSRYCSLLLE